MTTDALFASGPYVGLVLFAAATALRYLVARRRMATAESQLADAGRAWWGRALWRAGAALLLLGHLAGFLFPKRILAWDASPTRLYLLEFVAFASGVAALAGWLGLMWRHLERDTPSAAAELAETAFLSVLGVVLTSGLLAAVLYRWGSSWGVMTLTPYAVSLMGSRPAPELASQLPFPVQLHVAAALAALAFAPVTRLGLVLSVALHRTVRSTRKHVGNLGRAVESWARKHSPAPWIWPDED